MKNLKTAKKQSSKSGARKGAKKALKARKAAKAPRAKRASTEKARTPLDPVQKINVVDAIAAMMSRAGGASMDEMVAATGYDAHQMRAKIKLVRDRLGYTTTAPSKENGYRYHAVAPKAEG